MPSVRRATIPGKSVLLVALKSNVPWRDLHEIGAGPDDVEDLHATAPAALGAGPSNGTRRVASAVGPDPRRRAEDRCRRIPEVRQRRRWPHAVATRRARGGCGRMLRCSSLVILQHRHAPRALPPPRKTHARGVRHYSDRLLGTSSGAGSSAAGLPFAIFQRRR